MFFCTYTYNGAATTYMMNSSEPIEYNSGWRNNPYTYAYEGISYFKIAFANPSSTIIFLVPGYVYYPTNGNTTAFIHIDANQTIAENLNTVNTSFVFIPD